MPGKVSGRRDGTNLMVTCGPDVCWTPMGSGMVPVAYTSTAFMDPSRRDATSVFKNGRTDFYLNTRAARITGHEPGTGKGVQVPGYLAFSHVKTASSSVYSEGWAEVRDGDPAWMNHPDIGPTEPRRGEKQNFDCRARLKEAQDKATAAQQGGNPIARNRGITQAYRDLAAQAPNNQWIRLASYVSAQSGCAMQELGGTMAWLGGKARIFDPGQAQTAIGAINNQIFNSIYPYSNFVAQHGAKQLKECADREGWRVSPRLQSAFDRMERGDLRGAADEIARYEQREVAPALYNQYHDTFRGMEQANTVGSWVGMGDKRSIPLSYACGSGSPIPFTGSILNDVDRVRYYNTLMDALQSGKAR